MQSDQAVERYITLNFGSVHIVLLHWDSLACQGQHLEAVLCKGFNVSKDLRYRIPGQRYYSTAASTSAPGARAKDGFDSIFNVDVQVLGSGFPVDD